MTVAIQIHQAHQESLRSFLFVCFGFTHSDDKGVTSGSVSGISPDSALGPYGMLVLKCVSASCKTSALHTVQSLWLPKVQVRSLIVQFPPLTESFHFYTPSSLYITINLVTRIYGYYFLK